MPEGPAQQGEFVSAESGERKPGRTAVTAHEPLPPGTELRMPAVPAAEHHEHPVGAQPPEREQQRPQDARSTTAGPRSRPRAPRGAYREGDQAGSSTPTVERIRVRGGPG